MTDNWTPGESRIPTGVEGSTGKGLREGPKFTETEDLPGSGKLP